MSLSPKVKADIDSKSHFELLRERRVSPIGDPRFQGDSGKYWGERVEALRAADPRQGSANSRGVGNGC